MMACAQDDLRRYALWYLLWEMTTDSLGWQNSHLKELDRHRIIRRLIGMEVTELVQATDQRLRESGVRSVDELQRLPYNVVGFSEDMHRRNRQMKDFLYSNLYRHYRVVRMAVKAERVISDLFQRTRLSRRCCQSTFRK
jgi:dGTPase